jgi:mannan endo-1,4-beta-mannosidase
LNNDYKGKKIVTLGETGSFPDVDNLMADEAAWSYFMPWYGDFVRNSKYNSLALWNKMFASDYVYTLDKMPDLKSYKTPVTGIGSIVTGKTEDIKLYPVPVSDLLHISAVSELNLVSIFDLTGKLIYNQQFYSNQATIPMNDFKSGFYIVKAGQLKANNIYKY